LLTPGCPASSPWVGHHSIGSPKSGNAWRGHPNARTNIGVDVAVIVCQLLIILDGMDKVKKDGNGQN
jgi:hypothetical protein